MGRSSFTLIELLVTAFVATLVLGGVMVSLINGTALNEYSQELTMAMNIARAKLESDVFAKRAAFSEIVTTTNGQLSLAADGLAGIYRIEVTDLFDGLKTARISICWRSRGRKTIGDCREDTTDHFVWGASYTSPCVIETAIARR